MKKYGIYGSKTTVVAVPQLETWPYNLYRDYGIQLICVWLHDMATYHEYRILFLTCTGKTIEIYQIVELGMVGHSRLGPDYLSFLRPC